jgi:hypothetical protein
MMRMLTVAWAVALLDGRRPPALCPAGGRAGEADAIEAAKSMGRPNIDLP